MEGFFNALHVRASSSYVPAQAALERLQTGETLTASVAEQCQTFNPKCRHKDATFHFELAPIGLPVDNHNDFSNLSTILFCLICPAIGGERG